MSGTPAGAEGAGIRAPLPVERRGWRRGVTALAVLSVLLTLLLLAVLALPRWFDARRVAGLVLDRAGAATGLAWTIDGDPALRWRPHPRLVLPGLAVRDGRDRLLLAATRVELALPWSTLLGGPPRIEALHLDGPVIDLDAALDWWQARPAETAERLPELLDLRVSDGRLHGAGIAIDHVQLSLPHFRVGTAMSATASGRVAAAPAAFGFRIHLAATPGDAPFRLDDLVLEVSGDGPVPATTLAGHLQLSPWRLQANGELAAWPAGWPALPAPLAQDPAPIAYRIDQHGPSALAAETSLRLSRGAATIELHGVPAGVLAWRDAGERPALPPLSGRAELPLLELGDARFEGLRIELGEAPSPEPPP